MIHEVLDAVKTEIPEKPSQLTKVRVPKMLEDVTMSCLQKDPAQRPDSMSELMRSLRNWELSSR